MGSQRVRHNRVTEHMHNIHIYKLHSYISYTEYTQVDFIYNLHIYVLQDITYLFLYRFKYI